MPIRCVSGWERANKLPSAMRANIGILADYNLVCVVDIFTTILLKTSTGGLFCFAIQKVQFVVNLILISTIMFYATIIWLQNSYHFTGKMDGRGKARHNPISRMQSRDLSLARAGR